MAEIELTEETKLTAEQIDALKVFAAEKDGRLVLDTAKLKTETDVENVLRSKKNADAELSGVKQTLADVQAKLGKYQTAFGDGDPETIHAELEELRKGSGDLQQRLIAAVQNGKSWEKKFTDQQPEFERYKAAAEKEAKREISDKMDAIWAKKRVLLDPKWSKRKADILFRDLKKELEIAQDDPEDFAVMADGRTVMEHMEEKLDLMDAYENIKPGLGNPGGGNPMNKPKEKDMFERAVSGVKF